MSLRTLLLLLFTLFYFVVGHWWYTHKISGICSAAEASNSVTGIHKVPTVEDASSNDVSDVMNLKPLTFNWSEAEAMTSDEFEDYKSSILRNLTDENVLEITGHYYADEAIPDGYENMGFARAAEIKALFKDVIPGNRIITNSELISGTEEDMESSPFEAAAFNWIGPIDAGETTIAEIDNRILIFFPFNSSIKDVNKEVEDYLSILADRLEKTGERVLIVGHTDSTGDAKYNYDLGLQRAITVRNNLVNLGADRNKISVDSKGETQPIASNRTSDGEQKNRRVVLILK